MPRNKKIRVQAEVRQPVNIDQLVTAFVILAEAQVDSAPSDSDEAAS